MPVIINSINELNGSTWNENGTRRLPALIQSNSGIITVLTLLSCNSRKIAMLTINDDRTVRLPITPATDFGRIFLPKPMMIKPIKGNKGTNQTKFIMNVVDV